MLLAKNTRLSTLLCLAAVSIQLLPAKSFAVQSNLPLDQAARDGNVAEVGRLLQLGADPNGVNKWGLTPLTGASSIGAETAAHTEIVRLLLANGADVNRRAAMGTTALNEAAFAGNEATVGVLIEAGAAVNDAKNNGWTPLHSAAAQGFTPIVQLLLQHGANPELKNSHGQSPQDLALAFGNQSTANAISQFMARGKKTNAPTSRDVSEPRGAEQDLSVLDETEARLLAESQAQLRKDFPGIEFKKDGSIASDTGVDTSAAATGPRKSKAIVIGNPNAPNRLPSEMKTNVASQEASSTQRRTEGGVLSNREGMTALDYVISFTVTWVVILVPPILIRVFRRRPLTKTWAIAVCALFWCVNIIVFMALGSTSKYHTALIIGAYFSYLILRRTTEPRHASATQP